MISDLFELLDEAVREKCPFLLVEGKDDPQIYARIAEKAGKEVKIFPVNMVEDYTSGCDNVIKAIDKLQPKFDERPENEHLVLGIIDRDSRPYRPLQEDEIDYRTLKSLFILKYYSIETYFATRNNLKKLIEKLTYLSANQITDEILDFVEDNFQNYTNSLYFISLEALKYQCSEDYSAQVQYGHHVKDKNRIDNLYEQLESQKVDLESFAESKNIEIHDLKLICKGKWYLAIYICTTNHQIKSLVQQCKDENAVIPKCAVCEIDTESCQYKYKGGYQTSGLENDILEYIDEEECQDIIQAIQNLH